MSFLGGILGGGGGGLLGGIFGGGLGALAQGFEFDKILGSILGSENPLSALLGGKGGGFMTLLSGALAVAGGGGILSLAGPVLGGVLDGLANKAAQGGGADAGGLLKLIAESAGGNQIIKA